MYDGFQTNNVFLQSTTTGNNKNNKNPSVNAPMRRAGSTDREQNAAAPNDAKTN